MAVTCVDFEGLVASLSCRTDSGFPPLTRGGFARTITNPHVCSGQDWSGAFHELFIVVRCSSVWKKFF